MRRGREPRSCAAGGPRAGWAPGPEPRRGTWSGGAPRETAERGPGDPGASRLGEGAVRSQASGEGSQVVSWGMEPVNPGDPSAAVSFRISARASGGQVLIRILEKKVP